MNIGKWTKRNGIRINQCHFFKDKLITEARPPNQQDVSAGP